MNSRPDVPSPQPNRAALLARLSAQEQFDLVIIGGGATGLGVAVDAVTRGLSVALFEREDFAKGTSSRATKLVHGGVRYLAQGNVSLVREALRERTTLLHNAPHLARPLPFVMPVYGRRGALLDKWFYGAGLVAYDMLAGSAALGKTEFLSRQQTLQRMPGVNADGLAGAVQYWDGQFDDARLALALARTAIARGACVLNHCPVVRLVHDNERIAGVVVRDALTGAEQRIAAGCVINATGVWVDAIRTMDREQSQDMVAPSQGVHLVVDRAFLPGDHAMLVPRTRDGRVLFAVPWMGKTILGTTDTPRRDLALEPTPFAEEVAFILDESARYLAKAPTRDDVRSVWVGLRPLVRPPEDEGMDTKQLSREHTVMVSPSGLVTVTGGKWTTYRAMAEDVIEQCLEHRLVVGSATSSTSELALVGATETRADAMTALPGLHLYGSEAGQVGDLPGADVELAPGLSEAMVRFAARHEYACSVEDVLARRSRLLFLDAAMAARSADRVGEILGEELGQGFAAADSVSAFRTLTAQYQTLP